MRRCTGLALGGLFMGLLFQGCSHSTNPPENQVCFRNNCVDVEVVREKEETRRGLQFRRSLAAQSGMLFIFPENRRHAFWMKDTLIPLDMIWLDQDQRIVHIERQVPPCAVDPCAVYVPEQNALYVLEINAGHAGDMGLRVGEQMRFLSTSPIRVEGLIQNRG